MAPKDRTLTERLNRIADELEEKFPRLQKSEPGETASEALDRVEKAVSELP
jgi:hypothetical protein